MPPSGVKREYGAHIDELNIFDLRFPLGNTVSQCVPFQYFQYGHMVWSLAGFRIICQEAGARLGNYTTYMYCGI